MVAEIYSITYNPVTHATVRENSSKPGVRFIEVEVCPDHDLHKRYFEASHPTAKVKEMSRSQDVRDSADAFAKQAVKSGLGEINRPFRVKVSIEQ